MVSALTLAAPSAEDDYFAAIEGAIKNHPRSLQVRIGPSEIGQPCLRRLAYRLLGHPQRDQPPNWRATIGTAGHAWLETVFGSDGRWLTEQRVTVGRDAYGQPITGSVDLFDTATGTVIDHKFVGPTPLKKYRADGPGTQYRVQAHLYGQGLSNAGWQVRQVAVAFLPRNGELHHSHWWSEPFNPGVAQWGVERLHAIQWHIYHSREAGVHSTIDALPATESWCHNCPYYRARSTDLGEGCPGADPPKTNSTLTFITTKEDK